MKIYPQNPTDIQNPQQIHIQNPFNAQSFQPIQPINPMLMHSYQPTQMQNEIPLPYYLQRHEIKKNQLSHFSQMPNAAESLQMTMTPYLMGGSSITSNKQLMVFTGTDPEYSVEDYLNAVTANLILNIGPEPINTPLHQNWIHRRTALIQTTLDGEAQKLFSVLPIEIKSDWKRFIQEFSKMFDSERNKQHQRVLCNEVRRLPRETIKQLAVRIETLVRKAYSLNTHDYKNTKMTEICHKIDITDRIAKITKITIHDRIQTQQNLILDPVLIQTQRIDTIPIIDQETLHIIEIETIHIIEIEVIQIMEIRVIQTIDQGIIHIIDQIITDQMIIVKTDHKIIHKIETQVSIIDTEIIPSHHIGIITAIPILNIDTEVAHQNIKDTLIKCQKMEKQLQTPQLLMTQEVTNYN